MCSLGLGDVSVGSLMAPGDAGTGTTITMKDYVDRLYCLRKETNHFSH